ncbi:MAG: hypothetical protein JO157_18050 [Acetobacteraceae bacterium]|nr:hypothetical protein [Acetobacteraceae bacterium]
MIRLGATWLGLMLLLAVEFVAALAHAGWIAYATAPIMVLTLACVFMHAASASALSRIFAITGIFWITVLLGIGAVDYSVRKATPAEALTAPYTAAAPTE